MNIKKINGIATGAIGTVMGVIVLVPAIQIMMVHGLTDGVCLSLLVIALGLLVGSIGTLLGYKPCSWFLFISNSLLLLWLLAAHMYLGFAWLGSYSQALLATIILGATTGTHLFWRPRLK